ncbi:MAG: DUF305 domain-containing protein [Gemmataceae bacterium]|nr:DUF305 domain-containing protein [Gemmataceae bacterium]
MGPNLRPAGLSATVGFIALSAGSLLLSNLPSARSDDKSATAHAAHQLKSAPGAADLPFDVQFIDSMAAHHQMGVAMAALVPDRARHAELKEMAKKSIDDQRQEIQQLNKWRQQWYADKSSGLNMELPGMAAMKNMRMDKLKAASGEPFDLLFIDEMLPHHQGAIDLSRQALTKADHAELKKFAQKVIDAQEKEKEHLKHLKSQWSKEPK